MKSILRYFTFLPAVLMILLIYSFSAGTGNESSGLSLKVTEGIVEAVDIIFDIDEYNEQQMIEMLHTPIRKLAHMTEYALLAMSFVLPLYSVVRCRGMKLYALSWILALINAIFDEIHQLFVDGRAGKVTDVVIDSIGAALGILFIIAMSAIIRKCRRK